MRARLCPTRLHPVPQEEEQREAAVPGGEEQQEEEEAEQPAVAGRGSARARQAKVGGWAAWRQGKIGKWEMPFVTAGNRSRGTSGPCVGPRVRLADLGPPHCSHPPGCRQGRRRLRRQAQGAGAHPRHGGAAEGEGPGQLPML